MTSVNKRTVQTFFDALGDGDSARMETVLADGVIASAKGTGTFSIDRDRATILEAAGMLKAAIPGGIDFTVISMTEDDERVVAEVEGRAQLANGTPYNNSYAFVMTMKDGKIAHINEYYCTLLVENVLVPFAMGQAADQGQG